MCTWYVLCRFRLGTVLARWPDEGGRGTVTKRPLLDGAPGLLFQEPNPTDLSYPFYSTKTARKYVYVSYRQQALSFGASMHLL